MGYSVDISEVLIVTLFCSLVITAMHATKDEMEKVCKDSNQSEGIDLITSWEGTFFSISYSSELKNSGPCKSINLRLPSNESLLYSALTENGYRQIALYNLTDGYYERTMDSKGVKADRAKAHFFSAVSPTYGDVVERFLFAMDCKHDGTVEFFINVGDGDREEQQRAVDRAGFKTVDVTHCLSEWMELQPDTEE